MKKLLLVAALGVAGLVSAKTIENQEKLSRVSSFTALNTCTVSVTKCCEGAEKMITSTITSPTGDCSAAATVAEQQWNTNCMAATIKKVIEEAAPENP